MSTAEVPVDAGALLIRMTLAGDGGTVTIDFAPGSDETPTPTPSPTSTPTEAASPAEATAGATGTSS